ncbi:MAG TPA: hypothetical protein VK204_11925 [Nocardioidaceae bacterium]|nr:hypothetical protein [Nocardioidaceae bacterium]
MNSQDTTALLRAEVGRLRAHESRRRFDTVVHVGSLGGSPVTCPVPSADPVLDIGTRTDVVATLLANAPVTPQAACVWLTRAGDPQLQDEDLAWLSATCSAFGAVGRRLGGFWTVTRTGWLDVRSGEGRTWKRLRI